MVEESIELQGSNPKPTGSTQSYPHPRRNSGSSPHRRSSSSKDSHQFEQRRADQVRIWSENRHFFAAKNGLLKVLKEFERTQFLNDKEALDFYLKQRDPVGATVLHIAILCESINVAKYLIKAYGQPLVQQPYEATPESPYEGETALHLAIVKGYHGLVKMLVQHGAKINGVYTTGMFFRPETQLDKGIYFGSTPLHFAVCSGDLATVEYLLNHNADALEADSKGNTALHLAVLYGNKEMYDLIAARDQAFEGKLRVLVRINTCANIRDITKNHEGFTPLRLSASLANKDMFEHVLNRSCELNWSFGPIKEYLYPLNELDIVEDDSVLDILIQRGTLEHAELLRTPPIYNMLAEKWYKFGKTSFAILISAYTLVIACLLAALFLTESPNSYEGIKGAARLALEIIVVCWVGIDTIAFEIIEMKRYFQGYMRGRRNEFYFGSIVFILSNWVFRIMLVICVVLRISNADEKTQRTFLSFMAVLGTLYLLHFARGIRTFSKFILMTERIAIGMRFWIIVYVFEIAGFALGYQLLFTGQETDNESNNLETMGLAMFALTKWTMGEFQFSPDDAAQSVSQPAAYILFFGFVLLSTIILLNILIAIMTSIYQQYDSEADALATMQWATTIVEMEYRLRRIRMFWPCWRTGTIGQECGGRPDVYYKVTLVKKSDVGSSDTVHNAKNYISGHAPTFHEKNIEIWENMMRQIDHGGNYIRNYEDMMDIFNIYNVWSAKSVDRETTSFILQDLVLNNVIKRTKELEDTVLRASHVVAAQLDPDGDDDIPYETLATFCRLSRLSLLQQRQQSIRSRVALIVVDCQNDFGPYGPVPVLDWYDRELVEKINNLREQFTWDMDWHPENHCSFFGFGNSTNAQSVFSNDDDIREQPTNDGSKVCFPDNVESMTWPPHCLQDTKGAQLIDGIKVDSERDFFVTKGEDPTIDSFSAFWNNDRSNQTRLFEYLFDNNIEDIYIVGMGFDCAVGWTARDAAAYDATCLFDHRWTNEMYLQLCDSLVNIIQMEDVSKNRTEHENLELNQSSIRQLSSCTKKDMRRRPTHQFVRLPRVNSDV